jgi:xylitol oxidase
MTEQHSNWAASHTYRAARLHHPETIEQLQALVRHGTKLKALGTRHSFHDIADSEGDQISLARLRQGPVFDHDRRTVTVDAGASYGEICEPIARAGYALRNMASLPHVSLAGACATATHGSGDQVGNLASAVAGLELVTADGSLVELSRERDGEQFFGAVVALGGLGVVTRVTLDLVPSFDMRLEIYERLPLAELDQHFDTITASAYSVSLFVDWRSEYVNNIWLKQVADTGSASAPAPEFFGATLAPPPAAGAPEPWSAQMARPGPWHARLPHFRMDQTPSLGVELQSEYLVPRQHARAAIRAVAELGDVVAPVLHITEIRTIAADQLWMSPCYKQDCVGIHFTWHKNWPAVQRVLPLIEAALAPLGAIPHWGKLFTLAPERVRALYPRLPDFQRLLADYDPQGKFRNDFLDQYIFGVSR